ncbi:hypothetical protein KIPB_012271 [Kipferlia bialata]|uniref:Uncharacterized protein n=1 Tax=Kipferlia bialata TaxID=797122 RepID=A0A9K3D7M6_9EUKA|nr:hypothetical protein KIPB_012271 [Kipferlia bialata]|eukprot:g12271.t1
MVFIGETAFELEHAPPKVDRVVSLGGNEAMVFGTVGPTTRISHRPCIIVTLHPDGTHSEEVVGQCPVK